MLLAGFYYINSGFGISCRHRRWQIVSNSNARFNRLAANYTAAAAALAILVERRRTCHVTASGKQSVTFSSYRFILFLFILRVERRCSNQGLQNVASNHQVAAGVFLQWSCSHMRDLHLVVVGRNQPEPHQAYSPVAPRGLESNNNAKQTVFLAY